MRITGACVALALAAGVTAGASAQQPMARDDDRKTTITGCYVKGDGGGDGFLLANNVERTTTTTTTTGAQGAVSSSTTTTDRLKPSRLIYWLDDDDDVLEGYEGQQVEVVGEIEGDVERGEIDIERERGMIELEIDADGRQATLRLPDVPSAVGTSGSVTDDEVELRFIVRKLDVKSARSLASSCQ